MANEIDAKTLEYLSMLSRVGLGEEKARSEKLLKDLKNILNHFEELKALDTKNVPPLSHGIAFSTILRDDVSIEKPIASREELLRSFSNREGDFLKIPPVFKDSKS